MLPQYLNNAHVIKPNSSAFINRISVRFFLNGLYVREDTHKKSVLFSGQTTMVLPSLHQWLCGPCHFFFFFSYNSLKRILTVFFPNFLAKTAGFFFLNGFLLSGQGVFYPPYTHNGLTT